MKIKLLRTRYIAYILALAGISWFLFNFLLARQSRVMYDYFIERPADYNIRRAERIAQSIRNSFYQEISKPSKENIHTFVEKYDDIPFLSVNFIYKDPDDILQSIKGSIKDLDILGAEYAYPISRDGEDLGTLLVYDINEAYERGLEEYQQLLLFTRVFFALLLFLVLSILVYREYSYKIDQEKKLAQYEAVHDGLTGLYTQKYFKQYLQKEISRSQRYKRPLSLIMCDVDRFKHFNDTYGHLAGDNALKQIAGIIKDNTRSSDIVARYGGEEFAVLLVEAGHEEAKSVAKRLKSLTSESIKLASRIKDSIEEADFKVKKKILHLTISLGISSYNGHEDYKKEYLIGEADHALYESKNKGRNLVTIYNPDTREFHSFS